MIKRTLQFILALILAIIVLFIILIISPYLSMKTAWGVVTTYGAKQQE